MSKIFCKQIYEYIEINHIGDVRMCCEHWCSGYTIGNILENSLDEILAGEKYKTFAKQFEEQNFTYCDLNVCPLKVSCSDEEYDKKYNECTSRTSKILRINFDSGCNLRCIFCREIFIKSDTRKVKKLLDKIREMLPYMDENEWTISIDGSGEVFTSKHHLEFIKEVADNYPKIKFSIITNGVLASKEVFEKLGIEDRLNCVEISVHACRKSTYDKMIICGDFKLVKKNLEYISELKRAGKFHYLFVNFAVNSINYKEMEKFAKWIIELGGKPCFLPLVKVKQIRPTLYEKLNIADETHPRYNDFVRMLKKPIFSSEKVSISQGYLDLKEKEEEKNIFKRIFKL